MKFINSGFFDRAFRVLLGTGLIAWAFFTNEWYKIPLFAIGCIPLVTGIIGWCPIYSVLGINTRFHAHKK
ncbi:DUF2892 domain-containing protein [Leptospira semungkisensis]|uniref:DUF2892 domain-containing protein n=1 Tax=Leptospira semungkisensis TaxID=2484985 RepID=A0A4R9FN79_9LEPT|nr:DUF2892 domain-containing protein [Leptospira semungkisensis]TGJ99176.1 DUF2892 domain-containing protein [Leptospira semungkisensis]